MSRMDLLQETIKILDNKKAMDIKYMETKEKTILTDYFVVATGTSNTHIKALADYLEVELKKEGISPSKVEGYNAAGWILMDYGDVIVNLFTEQERQYYNLEDLWDKAKKSL